MAHIELIIRGPAKVAGLSVQNGLVTAATNDAKTEDALPLLAFALSELYERLGNKCELSLEEYQALGDPKLGISPLENAVRQAADDVLLAAEPTNAQLNVLREAFIPALVRINEEGEYIRRPARWEDLVVESHELLEKLVKARLLIIQQEEGEKIIEVTHEALLRKWPKLLGWLDQEREFLIGKNRLEQSLHDWQRAKNNQKTPALLHGLFLTRARQWLVDHARQLSEVERNYEKARVKKQGSSLTNYILFHKKQGSSLTNYILFQIKIYNLFNFVGYCITNVNCKA